MPNVTAQTATVKKKAPAPSPAATTDKQRAIEKKKCVTPEFRLSFPSLIEPSSFQGADPKYSAVMLFPKEKNLGEPANGQRTSLKHAVLNAATEKWGPKEKWPKNLRMPFKDGDEKADRDGYPGHIYITASNKNRPGLVNKSLAPIINAEDIYPGCYCRAEVIAFAYDTAGNKGVSFSLQNVQKLRDGESFSGRKDAALVFDAVEDLDGSDDASSYEATDDLSDLGL